MRIYSQHKFSKILSSAGSACLAGFENESNRNNINKTVGYCKLKIPVCADALDLLVTFLSTELIAKQWVSSPTGARRHRKAVGRIKRREVTLGKEDNSKEITLRKVTEESEVF